MNLGPLYLKELLIYQGKHEIFSGIRSRKLWEKICETHIIIQVIYSRWSVLSFIKNLLFPANFCDLELIQF